MFYCDYPESIVDFIKNDQFQGSRLDHMLPLDDRVLEDILPNRAKKFQEVQWEFAIPQLIDTGIPRCLEERIILPFSKQKPLSDEDQEGFGTIYDVEIDMQYHAMSTPNGIVATLPSMPSRFIRKELARHKTALDLELRNLALLQLLRHPNIVKLSSCYIYHDKHHFLFPRVSDGDLLKLLNGTERLQIFERDDTFFTALSGLASAIHRIHHFTANKIDLNFINCHHDLKPKNILVKGDRFILADFGLFRFKLHDDGSKTPYRTRNGYEIALECQNLDGDEDTHDISRKSHIWSFGCILAYILAYKKEKTSGYKSFKNTQKFRLSNRMIYYYFHYGNGPNPGMHG